MSFSADVQIRSNQTDPARNQSGVYFEELFFLDRMYALIQAVKHQHSQNTHKQKNQGKYDHEDLNSFITCAVFYIYLYVRATGEKSDTHTLSAGLC